MISSKEKLLWNLFAVDLVAFGVGVQGILFGHIWFVKGDFEYNEGRMAAWYMAEFCLFFLSVVLLCLRAKTKSKRLVSILSGMAMGAGAGSFLAGGPYYVLSNIAILGNDTPMWEYTRDRLGFVMVESMVIGAIVGLSAALFLDRDRRHKGPPN